MGSLCIYLLHLYTNRWISMVPLEICKTCAPNLSDFVHPSVPHFSFLHFCASVCSPFFIFILLCIRLFRFFYFYITVHPSVLFSSSIYTNNQMYECYLRLKCPGMFTHVHDFCVRVFTHVQEFGVCVFTHVQDFSVCVFTYVQDFFAYVFSHVKKFCVCCHGIFMPKISFIFLCIRSIKLN